MRILLPPSEGKARAGNGAPVDPAALSLPEVSDAREAVLDALRSLCQGPVERARQTLGLSSRQIDALADNRAAATAATSPAAELYTGVLYEKLRLPELLSGDAARRTNESVLIFSGLWGVVAPEDRVPPYRLSMDVRLAPLGKLGAFWRSRLAEPLTERLHDRLIVDCRSTAYAAAFRPDRETAARTVTVSVSREREVAGETRRVAVSHLAKATRGAVAHSLLAGGLIPESPHDLADALTDLGYRVERAAPARAGHPHRLDVLAHG